MHLFEQAEVDAEAFLERMYEARKITKGRANIQKRAEVGKNPAWPAGFPNRMPYFFSVLEDLLGLGGSTCAQDEDEQASGELATSIEAEASRGEEAADGDGPACPQAQAGLTEAGADGEVACWSAQEPSLAASNGDAPTVPEPASFLPEGVEVVEAAVVATWRDHLPGPQNGQLRAVSMLWGFVRDAISDHLTIARRSQLDTLTPKWDAIRPRTLLLLCETTWAARAAELTLRREIEPQLGKLLSDLFDEMQVVYAPGWEARA